MKLANNVVLVDTSWLLHRAYYIPQFKDMNVVSGQSKIWIGSVFHICSVHSSIVRRFKGDVSVIYCLDSGSNERDKRVDGYKANRCRTDEDRDRLREIYHPLEYLKGILSCSDRASFSFFKGLEADDLIAHNFFSLVDSGVDVYIYSGDNDCLQLMPYGAKVFRSFSSRGIDLIDDSYVNSKYGVPVVDLIYYRSIIGDPSDNIKPVAPRLSRSYCREIAKKWRESSSLDLALSLVDNKKCREKLEVVKDKVLLNYSIMCLRPLEGLGVLSTRFDPDYGLIDRFGLESYKGFLEWSSNSNSLSR